MFSFCHYLGSISLITDRESIEENIVFFLPDLQLFPLTVTLKYITFFDLSMGYLAPAVPKPRDLIYSVFRCHIGFVDF